jgi:hypothetical protein
MKVLGSRSRFQRSRRPRWSIDTWIGSSVDPKDQVAFTIGSTKGIAAVFCKVFAQEVPKIVGAERTIEMDEQVVKEIRTEGEKPIIDRKFIIAPGLLKNVFKA